MRKYAEDLVGALDRSYYNTQRDVANQAYQTNWDNLQNQYKNLQDKLKRQQEQANRNFANGLVSVSDDSFSRMRGANQDLTQRGLMTSGVRNLYNQADTTQKGADVKELLGTSTNVAVDIANQLNEANQKYAANQAELSKNLGDALGEVGAAETAAQMAYNKGLADIIGAAEERKAANAAAAASRGTGYEDKLSDAYIQAGILEVLSDPTLTDVEKEAMLKSLYGIGNAQDVLKAYKSVEGGGERREKAIKAAQKEYEEALEAYQNTNKQQKEKPSYSEVITPGQPGYEEQKAQVQSDPYAKRKDLVAGSSGNGNISGGSSYKPTASEKQAFDAMYENDTKTNNIEDKLGYQSSVPSSNIPVMPGNSSSYSSNSSYTSQKPSEAELKLQALEEANNRLQQAKMKDYSEDLYDLYQLLYGNR